MEWRVPLADVAFGSEEEEAVLSVMRSGWLTMGRVTAEFESAFAEFLSVPHAKAVSSCTAALHLACLALELGPGDEVIVPSLTFVATANAVRYTGATPVFADITGFGNFNLSPDSIREAITDKTKAIIVMHYAGYSCDMPAIMQMAAEHDLFVIEDAAHAVGGCLQGNMLGTWGDFGCYSFFSNKNLVTGEGGMLVTSDDELAEKVHRLRSHGMTSLTWDRHRGHAWSYDVVDLGYNYRLDELRSAIGLVQLQKLYEVNQKRRKLVELYRVQLAEKAPDLILPFQDHPGVSGAHLMPVLLPQGADRQSVMEKMKFDGVQTSIHYPPIHQFSSFQDLVCPVPLSITEEVSARELTLPLFPHMREEQVELVVSALAEAVGVKI
ncbi:MAG TPA: DegT/DnrJ/EryC1/StrS family aminotransferase [Anaerolineales bacterium]|nr:DegT/DnrJ/EryC1/StrS family aminotransferase [Anaerolineales bacterium]